MPKYFVPTGLIVDAEDAIQAQAFAYGLLSDVINAEVAFGSCEDCGCDEDCEQPTLADFWTYDYDDTEHPVEALTSSYA